MAELRAFLIPSLLICAASSCSLLAPSDAALMGDNQQVAQAGQADTAGKGPTPQGDAGAVTQAGLGSGGVPTADATGGVPGGYGGNGGDGSAGMSGGAAPDPASLSGQIPQDKLLLWLLSDHGIGEADGGVAVWADQSPNHADAKQSIISLRPKVAAAIGAAPHMLEFDGIDDQLALPEGFSDFSQGLSAFVIARESADSYCPSLLHLSNEPEQDDIEVGRFNGSIHYEVQEEDMSGTDNAFALNQTVLLSVIHQPNKMTVLRINDVYMTSGEFMLPVVKKRLNNFVGRSLYSDCGVYPGQIGEIIVYARALTNAEREQVQAYLQKRWSYIPPVKTHLTPGDISRL